jgi:anti-anti-sigma regulatory factor
VRNGGQIDVPTGRSPGDHLCWVFDGVEQVQDAAVAFAGEGLDRRERVFLVGLDDTASLRAALAAIGDVDALLASGALTLASPTQTYSGGFDAQADAYGSATRAALASGYTGLRVAADATSLVTTAEDRAAFTAYEHRIDRKMLNLPFTAMCAYDTRVLGGAVEELTCLHPFTNHHRPGFRLFADEGGVALAGEVDGLSADRLSAAVERLGAEGPLRVDATELTFVDHGGLVALASASVPIELVTRSELVARLVRLLELDQIAVRVIR